jgi:hypothetical protein
MTPEDQVLVAVKSKWRSFTNWFNGVIALLLAADWASAAAGLPSLQAVIPPVWYQRVVIVVTVANILIRTFKTKGPVR